MELKLEKKRGETGVGKTEEVEKLEARVGSLAESPPLKRGQMKVSTYLDSSSVQASDARGSLLDGLEYVTLGFVGHDLGSDGVHGEGIMLHLVLSEGSLLSFLEFNVGKRKVESFDGIQEDGGSARRDIVVLQVQTAQRRIDSQYEDELL